MSGRTIGTMLTGWQRVHEHTSCEHCGAWSSRRTIYKQAINRWDPDEGDAHICFICILRGYRELGW